MQTPGRGIFCARRFYRVAAGTPEVRVADCAFNADAAISMMNKAFSLHCAVLVLPELCLTGYTCSDLFLQDKLLSGAEEALGKVIGASAGMKMLVFVGLPFPARGKLYNCAAAICDGRLLGLVPKSHIPNYSEFYEARHFTPAPDENISVRACGFDALLGVRQLFSCVSVPDLIVGAEICEDLWVPSPPSSRRRARARR
jgi:NAD+ synthase (glutamine-hydrolysing)